MIDQNQVLNQLVSIELSMSKQFEATDKRLETIASEIKQLKKDLSRVEKKADRIENKIDEVADFTRMKAGEIDYSAQGALSE